MRRTYRGGRVQLVGLWFREVNSKIEAAIIEDRVTRFVMRSVAGDVFEVSAKRLAEWWRRMRRAPASAEFIQFGLRIWQRESSVE